MLTRRTVALAPRGLTIALAVLVLAACETVDEQFTAPKSAWEGTSWVAEDIGGNGVIDILQSRITFAEEGRVNGNAGCNTFFGSYQTDGEAIRFSPMAMTEMMCEAEAVNNQEAAFLAALDQAEFVRIENDIMYLDDADGNTVMRLSMVEVAGD
jgi:heat shock protein HslJ